MDTYTKTILTIIAVAASLIALKLHAPNSKDPRAATLGDFIALRNIEDAQQRRAALANLQARIPVLWIQGGNIDAAVSGNVLTDR